MSGYAVAHLEEIDEISDGRCPMRPVRHHFGITSFGVNAWTGREAGDRIINEHDESEEQDLQEELYLVQQRPCDVRARRRAGGRAGRHLRLRPPRASSGRRSPRSRGRRSSPSAEYRGRRTSLTAARSGRRSTPSTSPVGTPRSPTACARSSRPIPSTRCCSTTSPAARASLGGRPTRSSISGSRSSVTDRLRSLAAEDSDLDPIRDDRAFKELIGS